MITLSGFHGRAARWLWLLLSFCALLTAAAVRPAFSQSQMYIYPAKGQNQQQQDKDRYECHTWAVQQTGFDPSKAYPSNRNYYDPQPYNPSQPHVMKGAGRGRLWEPWRRDRRQRGQGARRAPQSAASRADFGAATSAGSRLLRNNRDRRRRLPPFRPDISARWPRVWGDAGTPSTDDNLVLFLLLV